MLIYAGIGDAYGAAFEFVPLDEWQFPNDGKHFYKHPALPIGNGHYTDDTQTSIAVVKEMLVYDSSAVPTPTDFLGAFYDAYQDDPRPGYGKAFQMLLSTSKSAADLARRIRPDSTRSGAIMRAAPTGGYDTVEKVKEAARNQAMSTHNTEIAIESACAVGLAAHYLIHRVGKRADLGKFLNQNLSEYGTINWNKDRTTWAEVEAVECAQNAITAWRKSRTITEVLINSVAPGGDTDTVATVAMSLAWADPYIRDDLDLDLISDFEPNSNFGFEHLYNLTHEYVERFCKWQTKKSK